MAATALSPTNRIGGLFWPLMGVLIGIERDHPPSSSQAGNQETENARSVSCRFRADFSRWQLGFHGGILASSSFARRALLAM
jgi:hypothetical protein